MQLAASCQEVSIMKKCLRRKNCVRPSVERLESRKLLAALLGGNDLTESLWSFPDRASTPPELTPGIRATDFRLATLDGAKVQSYLSSVPANLDDSIASNSTLAIPRPDGTFERFQIYVSSIMEPELAAKFPEIQTYAGQGIDDPASTVRFDVTPHGFHAQVRSPSGAYYIDPYSNLPSNFYAVYARGSGPRPVFEELETQDILAGLGQLSGGEPPSANSGPTYANRSGAELRTFRLAVAATGEYTAFHGGTVALGQAAIVTAVNRLAGIYQTEMSISFRLVANNDQLVYTNAATDPYTNNNGFTMLGENQANVDRVIGSANYDMGHVFSTGGGGVAALASVGVDRIKAQGVTGLPTPIGDEFYVDYVAHEMGHQFGGNHTFNSNAGSCQGNRNTSTAYEPGSGTTIQAYAGICDSDDLQRNSDPYFHSASLDEFVRHVDVTIPRVGTRTQTGNNIPIINAGPNFTIPASTPFVLTAVGSDADVGDRLTYDWQQRDLGPTQTVAAADNGLGPLFRVWSPTTDPSRTFPRLSDLVNNRTAVGEKLPTTNRQMNFRVIARDNRIAGGAFDDDDMVVSVVNTGAPFAIQTPNTNVSWEGFTQQNVTWNVAGTNSNGINALSVNISLSTDGGLTYPFVLASGVPNNGFANVRIPNVPTTTARVRVQGAANIFFDISDVNFTITPASQVIDISLGPNVSFVEDSLPVLIAPNATLDTISINTFAGGVLTTSIAANYESGDALSISHQGSGPGEISVDGNQIGYEGTEFGTSSTTDSSLSVTFNSSVTSAAISALLTRLTFVHSTNDPAPNARTVSVYLDNTVNGASNVATVLVNVVPVNDPPQIRNVLLASIDEDTQNPSGSLIGSLAATGFTDPDRNSSMSGVVITRNPLLLAAGQWQYSLTGASWLPIGSVNTADGLVLSSQSRIRFLPALNFFGSPSPLAYRGLDNTFSGPFTTATRAVLDVSAPSATGPVSFFDGNIGIVVNPVNDAPIANVGAQAVSVDQDQTLSLTVPTVWFTDVDSTTLMYSMARSDGSALPQWLSFDPATRRLVGIPKNADVGDYSLIIRATDSAGLFGTISLFVTVANVNDAPTAIQLAADSVVEGTADLSGKFLGTLFATDPDSEDEFTWTVTDSRFEIRGNTLFLAPGSKLDYEAGSRVSLMVQVTDNGIPPLSYEQQATIDLIDVNEFAPALRSASFSVNEGVAGSTILGVLDAVDGDTANKVRFRFLGTPPTLFSLNPNTGEIRLAANGSLDHERASSYQFFVEAVDNGIPQLATTASVNVVVRDVNEFDPQITTSLIHIPESQVTNEAFAKVVATDLDTNQFIRFSLPATETRFSINPVTGDLSLVLPGIFDFENNQVDSVVVLATDSGTPARIALRTITIAIDDANDPPTAASVADPRILSNVSGLNLGVIAVVDQDVGQQYSIVSLDDRFVVVNGSLTVAPGKSVGDSDALQIVVPIIATEIGTSSNSYPLSVNLVRTPNPRPWQNQLLPEDVDRIGGVNPLDVLAIVNAINGDLVGTLPFPRPASTLVMPDYDVDADGSLTPLDALAVINFLNALGRGEGEETSAVPPPLSAKLQNPLDDTWLIAFNQLEEEQSLQRRKRTLSLSETKH